MTVELNHDGLPEGVIRIHLAAPRANALVPPLLADLHAALDTAEAEAPRAIVLSAERNFCSGGDINGFHAAALADELESYSGALVPELQRLVLRLIEMPGVILLAARGALTGGGAGFLFASDIAVLSEDAFVQPYYNTVGFAPDGGWCAVLPERIGLAQTQSWLATNRRVRANELHEMGLAARVVAPGRLDQAVADLLEATDLGTVAAAKSIFWDQTRRKAVSCRLEAEAATFLDRIAQPEIPRRLAAFLESMREPRDV